MERENKYIDLLIKRKYDELANISFIDDLVKISYNNRYLIEYLLEDKFHSPKMDEYLKYHLSFAKYYLKYHIINPLLECSLNILLESINGKDLILDELLNNINDNDKMILYQKIKINSYTEYHRREGEVVKCFLRHGILINPIFITTNVSLEKNNIEDEDLLIEFNKIFYDTDNVILRNITNIFHNDLLNNRLRALNDIKKIIEYKKEHQKFKFIDSQNNDGNYDSLTDTMKVSLERPLVFEHEFSHLLYQSFENQDEIIKKYKKIIDGLDKLNIFNNIIIYLKKFHKEYEHSMSIYRKEYDELIKQKYGSFDNYLNKVTFDIQENMPEFIRIYHEDEQISNMYDVNLVNASSISLELLEVEKEEYIRKRLHTNYSEELMFENLLDAILMGKIFDYEEDFKCLSGHGILYFKDDIILSLDECLANYDAICKTDKKEKLKGDLISLIGDDLTFILDEYIKKNREGVYERR